MNKDWHETLRHLDEGNFSALQTHLGGPGGFHRQMVAWHSEGEFINEPEALAEALSCACMLGQTETVKYLLDAGVEPYSGMKTGLSGPHYAVSSGRFEVLKLLVDQGIDLEVANSYGGTLFGQALWSAVNEPKAGHPKIIDLLLTAGAKTLVGTLDWWQQQNVPAELNDEISTILKRHDIS